MMMDNGTNSRKGSNTKNETLSKKATKYHHHDIMSCHKLCKKRMKIKNEWMSDPTSSLSERSRLKRKRKKECTFIYKRVRSYTTVQTTCMAAMLKAIQFPHSPPS